MINKKIIGRALHLMDFYLGNFSNSANRRPTQVIEKVLNLNFSVVLSPGYIFTGSCLSISHKVSGIVIRILSILLHLILIMYN